MKIQDQKRILVVDDEKDSTGLVMHHLGLQMQMAGCEIIHVDAETDAVEICKKSKPTLIILDLMVPEIEGWKILKRLRDESETKDIPVMIMTERSGTGFDVGADDYMTKPFSPRELVTRVRRFLKRPKVKGRSSCFYSPIGIGSSLAVKTACTAEKESPDVTSWDCTAVKSRFFESVEHRRPMGFLKRRRFALS